MIVTGISGRVDIVESVNLNVSVGLATENGRSIGREHDLLNRALGVFGDERVLFVFLQIPDGEDAALRSRGQNAGIEGGPTAIDDRLVGAGGELQQRRCFALGPDVDGPIGRARDEFVGVEGRAMNSVDGAIVAVVRPQNLFVVRDRAFMDDAVLSAHVIMLRLAIGRDREIEAQPADLATPDRVIDDRAPIRRQIGHTLQTHDVARDKALLHRPLLNESVGCDREQFLTPIPVHFGGNSSWIQLLVILPIIATADTILRRWHRLFGVVVVRRFVVFCGSVGIGSLPQNVPNRRCVLRRGIGGVLLFRRFLSRGVEL